MNYLKIFFSILLCINFLKADNINPSFSLMASGGVTDLVFTKDKLYAGTTASALDIFDFKQKQKIKTIKLNKIKDFMGDEIDSKIYSIDILDNDILILSQGNKGGRNIDIYKDNKFINIISDKKRLFIAKAKYINKDKIVYALLSNQIFIYDLKSKKILAQTQISQSRFSNFVLNEDKSKIIVTDESGILTMLDTKNLKVLKSFSGQNVDNVFQVDTKNNYVLTAGQDRRSAVFSYDKSISYHKKFGFLIYSVGLSPSAQLAGVASNEDNDVTIFNIKTKENLHTLKQNLALLTNILFINENEIFVSSEQEKINYFNIKEK